MSESYVGGCAGGAARSESGDASACATWFLSLAAAPTFAVMALLAGAFDAGALDMLCSAAHHASPLGGIVVMYLLMSALHSAPWLNLCCARALTHEQQALGGLAKRNPPSQNARRTVPTCYSHRLACVSAAHCRTRLAHHRQHQCRHVRSSEATEMGPSTEVWGANGW